MARFQGCGMLVKWVTLHLCKPGEQVVGAMQKQQIRMSSEDSFKTEDGETGSEDVSYQRHQYIVEGGFSFSKTLFFTPR